ncbi:MAG: UvrD-helicase domain-containing protein [Oscillospiraceae bacterium]|nr:UvrD-helicase domain-containing protein [Oscillospiraceae bacterium]
MTNDFEKRFLEARRALIRADFKQLNERQQEAVLATEGALLILAGAGSGKTTVLIHRIANLLKYGCASDSDELPPGADEAMLRLLEQGGPEAARFAALRPVEPWRILAITFTNKAAGELKERLSRMLGDQANDIWALTFHSACVRILRRDAQKLGFAENFTIYDTADSQSLVKRILNELDLDEKSFPPRTVLGEISYAKDAQLGPAAYKQFAAASSDYRRQKIALVYEEYMRRLFAANAMDFDDLIYFTVKLLQEHEDARDYWQRRFRYVLIDEYQDTNHLQYLLASTLAGGSGNICVVGDDDQSIYKFRGATIENILSFEDQYRGCRTIRLEQNYRSTGHILDAANAVIRNNVGRKGKELWTDKGSGLKIRQYTADNENEEAQYVASHLLSDFSQGANWRDSAVLYRMNAQSSQLEFALKRNGIPYRIVGGTRFFDHAEIKDMLAYLNVINTPADDLRLSRIINVPPRGIGERSAESARLLAAENGCSLFEILSHADNYPELSRAAMRMRLFANMIEELRAFAAENSPDALYDELLNKTGYLRLLQESDDDKDRTRAENVEELKSSMLSFMKESGDDSLEGYLANVALYTDLDNYDRDADAVVLMTMHSAKGLEFPTVYLVGMEEGIFPGIRAIGEREEMEEERRLCYVAITRAKRQLYLLCARQRMLFGRTTANRASRFIDEIPEEHIEKNIPKGYAYRDPSREMMFAHPRQEPKAHSIAAPAARPKPAARPVPDFALGDAVQHKAFGPGVITKLTPMGRDFLVEIHFEKVGPKKLMLRVAALNMTKL